MTLSGIGPGGSVVRELNPAEQVTGTGGQLASLLLHSQQALQQLEQAGLVAARADYRQALADEVEAMHEAADDVFCGAVVEGLLAVASGAATVGGALSREVPELPPQPVDGAASQTGCDLLLQLKVQVALQPTPVEVFGNALRPLAEPVGKLASQAEGQHALANARASAGWGEQAQWEASDAQDAIRRSQDRTGATIEWLDSLSEQEAAATATVLANLA